LAFDVLSREFPFAYIESEHIKAIMIWVTKFDSDGRCAVEFYVITATLH